MQNFQSKRKKKKRKKRELLFIDIQKPNYENHNTIVEQLETQKSNRNIHPETNIKPAGIKQTKNQKNNKCQRLREQRAKHQKGTWGWAAEAWEWSHREPWLWCCHQSQRPIRGCRIGGTGPISEPLYHSLPCFPCRPAMLSPASLRSRPLLVLLPLGCRERNNFKIENGLSFKSRLPSTFA